jgi:hypothetical protein
MNIRIFLEFFFVGIGANSNKRSKIFIIRILKIWRIFAQPILNGHFIMFWTDIFLCFERSLKSWPLNSRWVSASAYCYLHAQFQKLFKDLLASALAWFLPQMIAKHLLNCKKIGRWTDNWDDSLKTNIWPQRSIFRPHQSNFVCSNDKFVGDMGHSL